MDMTVVLKHQNSMTTGEDCSADIISSKTGRYILSDEIVKSSTILSGWNAADLLPSATAEDIVVPAAEFANKENYVKQPKACKKAVKWLTLITKWALQEGLSPILMKQIIEEHLEDFKHYISVDSATWDDFLYVFFARHKIDGATQFLQWYRHQRALGQSTWFSYEELQRATNKFSRALKCAEGQTRVVYKGIEQFSERFVAVKRFKKVTDVSLRKVLYEVALNYYIKKTLDPDQLFLPLVDLRGFSPNHADPLLVFEFVPNGNLRQHLQGHYGKYLQSHPSDRLCIAIDVANALMQLHCSCESPVYHRDVKSTNILLDNNYRAKLSDLSTAKIMQWKSDHSIGLKTELCSTARVIGCTDDVGSVGTPGYLDPVYEQTGELSDLTDVYSFGVVLLELATLLKAWDPERPVKLLSELVLEKMRAGNVSDIVGIMPGTPGGEAMTTMKLMLLLGLDCCSLDLKIRPKIDEVVEKLRHLQDELKSQDAIMAGNQIDTTRAAVGENCRKLTLATMVARK